MAYLAINDFKYGMDRRRKQAVGIPGTLWTLKNGVVSRGGDVERAKKFIQTHTLPSGTFGLGVLDNRLYVFGSDNEPGSMPEDIEYQQLLSPIPGGTAGMTYDMTGVVDAKPFDGKMYVIATYDDGGLMHFYNTTLIDDWTTLADDGDSKRTVAKRLAKFIRGLGVVTAKVSNNKVIVKAVTPGENFTVSTDVAENSDTPGAYNPSLAATTVQANVTEIAEVQATASLTINSGVNNAAIIEVLADGVDLLAGNPIFWENDVDDTAHAVVEEINSHSDTYGYTAISVGGLITLTANPGIGASRNGDVISVTTSGIIDISTVNVSGGVDYRAPVAKIVKLTVDADVYYGPSAWAVQINGGDWFWTTGLASNTGDSLYIAKQRVWSTRGGLLQYCKLNGPTDWTDTDASTGAGFINISSQSEGAQELYGVEDYNGKAAIFAESNVVLYTLAADAQNITIAQPLKNTGTFAPKSMISYGASDTFYLDKTGIRSLKSREGYDGAFTSDIGSAIDPFIRSLLNGTARSDAYKAISVIETEDGRFFMALKQKIIVLSYFPMSKITAWSYIQFDHDIDNMVRCGDTIYVRCNNAIYAYGGEDGTEYPDAGEYETVVETPFMSASDPAAFKAWEGFDQTATGEWLVELLPDQNDTSKSITIGRLTSNTFSNMAAKLPGYSAFFALRFTCDQAGFASLSSLAQHFEKGEKQ
jgi:hypothetical protein